MLSDLNWRKDKIKKIQMTYSTNFIMFSNNVINIMIYFIKHISPHFYAYINFGKKIPWKLRNHELTSKKKNVDFK